ncbi:DUF4345 domain-containing protein [Leptospira sp. WS92.C1]
MTTNAITMNRSENKTLSFISKLFLVLNTGVYAAFATGFFLIPVKLASLIGITLEGTAALADFRAMYGGLCLGIEAVLLIGIIKAEWRTFSVLLACTTAGGLLLGRVYTLLLDGPGNEFIYLSMATEMVAVLIGAWILKRS